MWSWYNSRVDIQGDVVFEDDVGTADYAIFITAENHYWWATTSTRTVVYVYASAHYYYEYDSGIGDYDEWDSVDPNLILWENHWSFDEDGGVWQWEIDSTEYYCTGNDESTTSGCSTSITESGQDDGIWQRLGYIIVAKTMASHKFDALIKLTIDNQKGEDYIEGRRWYSPDDGWYSQYITEIRIRARFIFQYYTTAWSTDVEHNHYLGDGSGTGDLPSLPLVEGVVDGLIY